MDEDKIDIEVEIVSRADLDRHHSSWFGFVHSVEETKDSRFISIMYAEAFGDAVVHLDLRNYYLLSILWKPDPQAPKEMVSVSTSPENQNEAFEFLGSLLDYANEAGPEEEPEERRSKKEMSFEAGPKRLEVTLKQVNLDNIIRDVVVTSVAPPKGSFKHPIIVLGIPYHMIVGVMMTIHKLMMTQSPPYLKLVMARLSFQVANQLKMMIMIHPAGAQKKNTNLLLMKFLENSFALGSIQKKKAQNLLYLRYPVKDLKHLQRKVRE